MKRLIDSAGNARQSASSNRSPPARRSSVRQHNLANLGEKISADTSS